MEENIRKAMSVQTDSDLDVMKTLGSAGKVQTFGNFYVANGIDIETVVASLLIKFSSTRQYNSEEYSRYREGVKDFSAFLRRCAGVENKKPSENA